MLKTAIENCTRELSYCVLVILGKFRTLDISWCVPFVCGTSHSTGQCVSMATFVWDIFLKVFPGKLEMNFAPEDQCVRLCLGLFLESFLNET